MDGMKKGTVRVAGHGTYEIDVTYSHAHENCGTCAILVNRGTGRQYDGPADLGMSLDNILTHYAYAIRYDDLHIHAKRIGVEVFEIVRGLRQCIAQYEITKEVSE